LPVAWNKIVREINTVSFLQDNIVDEINALPIANSRINDDVHTYLLHRTPFMKYVRSTLLLAYYNTPDGTCRLYVLCTERVEIRFILNVFDEVYPVPLL
jgi:hypothetical protein